MKRIFLFLAANLAVMLVLSVTVRLLGIDRFVSAGGLGLGTLMLFPLVVGFTGSIISLLLSKTIAKWSTGAHVIEAPRSGDEAWLVNTVDRLAGRAGIGRPEVAVFEGAPNADAGSARLGGIAPGVLPQSLRAFGITNAPAWFGLFASHPPVEARIAALQLRQPAAAVTSR